MRLLTLLAALLLSIGAFAPNAAKAKAHGGFIEEIVGHGGEIIDGLAAHGDHWAFTHSLDTIQQTGKGFADDANVASLLTQISALQAAYGQAVTETDGAVLMDASLREHYPVVHKMHDTAATLSIHLNQLAPRNADVIAMNAALLANKAMFGTDALCGFEAMAADGTLLSTMFWNAVENAPDQTRWQQSQANVEGILFAISFLAFIILAFDYRKTMRPTLAVRRKALAS